MVRKLEFSDYEQILNALPEPTIMLRDGTVLYYNPAAAAVLPELKTGSSCPAPLASSLPHSGIDGISVCIFSGKTYTVNTIAAASGDVVVLRPMREGAGGGVRWMLPFANQLREQMSGLLAAVQQLEVDLGESEDRQRDQWLAILNQSAYRLLRIAGTAELMHSLATGEAYRQSTLDLAGLCHGLEGEVAPLARQMGLNFQYESQTDSLLTIGDPALLRRMLLGLISNAMKAVHLGGSFGLRLVQRNRRALLTVWDSGPGMDERSLGALFQEEWSGSVPRPGEGLRFGLYNARAIAEAHGGVLVVESKPGAGSRFTVSLPVNPPDRLPLRTPQIYFDDHGGFSSLLVELSDALPWQVFLPAELE
jgi:signal transduction histidine kinase